MLGLLGKLRQQRTTNHEPRYTGNLVVPRNYWTKILRTKKRWHLKDMSGTSFCLMKTGLIPWTTCTTLTLFHDTNRNPRPASLVPTLLPGIKGISETIAPILQPYNISVASPPTTISRHLLLNVQEREPFTWSSTKKADRLTFTYLSIDIQPADFKAWSCQLRDLKLDLKVIMRKTLLALKKCLSTRADKPLLNAHPLAGLTYYHHCQKNRYTHLRQKHFNTPNLSVPLITVLEVWHTRTLLKRRRVKDVNLQISCMIRQGEVRQSEVTSEKAKTI